MGLLSQQYWWEDQHSGFSNTGLQDHSNYVPIKYLVCSVGDQKEVHCFLPEKPEWGIFMLYELNTGIVFGKSALTKGRLNWAFYMETLKNCLSIAIGLPHRGISFRGLKHINAKKMNRKKYILLGQITITSSLLPEKILWTGSRQHIVNSHFTTFVCLKQKRE